MVQNATNSAEAATRLDWVSTGVSMGGEGAAGKNPEGRVAILTLDQPGKSANLLSASRLQEIENRLNEIDAEKDVVGLVIVSAKPGVFIAGADLTEFVAGLGQPSDEVIAISRRGQKLLARLSTSDYLTIAAIDGVCVGGGAELAVWCDRRILADTPKTQLGFPEVKLGLFPGWGGTARTSRMIGLSNAVELITGGENIGAREAYKLGLAEDVVEVGNPLSGGETTDSPLIRAALRMIEAERSSGQWKRDRKRWSQPIAMSETELGFLGATASAMIQQKTKGFYPAPMAALELMLEASQLDLAEACQAESEAFAPLFGSPVNRALLNVFFLTDRAKKSSGASPSGGQKIKKAAVIGAGIMGQGIAAANLKRGIRVLLSDAREEALAAGIGEVIREASFNKATRSTDADLAIERATRIDGETDATRLAKADVVIEAIIENASIKKKLFAELEPHAAESTILCSNTSTIPITTLAEGLKRPDRFCGLHFFNPVRKMPLVEVIRGEKTSDATVEAMTAYARRLGKTPVTVNDGPGFLVNRLLLPYMNEAALLANEGVPFKKIDKTAKAFGMPMGPLELSDVVGLDTCVHAGRVMLEAFADRVVAAPILERLVEAERRGQKNGKGFYDYPPAKRGKPPRPVPSEEAASFVKEEEAREKGKASAEVSMTDRLLLPMLVEATRAVEEGIVDDVRDVDLALIYGIGFPPHRGGLFHWADTLGAAEIVQRLEPLVSLGKRFEPTEMLLKHAKTGQKFYG